jgi:hypothetical protein
MSDDRALRIEVSPDRLVAVAKCVRAGFSAEAFADAVLEEVSRTGIQSALDREELIRQFTEASDKEEDACELIVARGSAPSEPKEAELDWGGDFFSHQFVEKDATGSVDYRQFRSNPSVAAGQRLLTIIPGVAGVDGADVFGKRIAAQRLKSVRVRAGKNVRVDERGATYESEKDGRVRLVGSVLSVDEVYTVTGDVGLATGNINHPGALEVQGNIEADSQVRCMGHIKVNGYIESADVDAGGDLEVASGMTGIRTSPIRAAGTIRSKFIIDSNVVAGGDVWVDREIVHSVLSAGARILVPEGRIVGGRVYGRHAIDVRDVGSPAVVPTQLNVGRTESENDEVREIERRIEKLRTDADRIFQAIVPVTAAFDKMPPEKQKAVEKLMETEQNMKDEISQLKDELDKRSSAPRPTISIRGVIHPETSMCIDQVRLTIRETLLGPLIARRVGDRIRLEHT